MTTSQKWGLILGIVFMTGIAMAAPYLYRVTVYFPDGSATAPSLAFSGDTNTGVYRATTDTVGLAGGGAAAVTVTPGTMTLAKATSANLITSDTSAATMSASVPALRVKSSVTPDANDMLFEVMYGTTSVLSVDKEGDLTIAGSFTFSPGDVTMTGGDLTSSHATQTFNVVSDTNATTVTNAVAAITLAPSATLNANDLVLEVNAVAAGSAVCSVDLEGDAVFAGDITAAGNGLTCSATGATCILTSDVTDGTTSGTVGAITLKTSADITNSDLLLDVQDSAAAHALTLTEAGALTALTSITATTTMTVGGGTAVAKITSEQVDNQDLASAAANTCVTLAVTVAGATLGDSVTCSPVQDDAAWDEGNLTCFVESAGVVKLVYCADGTGGDPAATNDYRFTILRF